MKLNIRQTMRWCAIENDARPTPEKLRRDILRSEKVQTDFSIITVPAPPRDQTAFKVCGNNRVLLVGIALFDAYPQRISRERPAPMQDQAEICFDLYHDRLGFFHYSLGPDGAKEAAATLQTTTFLPYPEAHASSCPLLHVQKYEACTEYFPTATYNSLRCRWIFAWFDAAEVFRYGDKVGFNICRYRPGMYNEFSAWNFPSGNGGPDASGFGTLYRSHPEVRLSDVSAHRDTRTLHLWGRLKQNGKRKTVLRWTVQSPFGQSHEAVCSTSGNDWQAALQLKKWEAGRYRLRAYNRDEPVVGAEYFFDYAPAKSRRMFTVAMTYDPPMSIMPNYYTPERMRQEMGVIKSWGVDRLHWIDYSAYPSFWDYHLWKDNYHKTTKACGDFLSCAVEQAHANGLEIIPDLKVFDLAYNTLYHEHPNTVEEFDGRRTIAVPEIVAHPEWTMQSNLHWCRETSFPITRLRFYSRTPLPMIEPKAIRLLVSNDNRSYKKYSGASNVRQGMINRPHFRWTPAGKESQQGTERNWYLELNGLQLNAKFAALQIGGADVVATHQGFMAAEAFDVEGNESPLLLSTTGHRDFKLDGYFFWKEWPGWNNYTEPILQERRWTLNHLSMTFQEVPNQKSLLEPTFEGTRDIWLNRISKMLDAGADGVSIRTLNNHNGVMSWLQYAFAPIVVDTFQSRYRRLPQSTPENYERVRRIRGDAFTQFLRDAKKLTSAYGKKLIVQFESGIEIPAHLDTRMQIFFDTKAWIEERIMDEIVLKEWTAQSPWVHEYVLPLARRKNIPVHVTSRQLNNGFDLGDMALIPQLLTDAYCAGFSGVNFYEVDNLIEMNPEGISVPKGIAAPAMMNACRIIRELQD